MFGEAGSGVHALIQKSAIRRVENSLEIYSEEPWHLAEGNETSASPAVVFVHFKAVTVIPYAT